MEVSSNNQLVDISKVKSDIPEGFNIGNIPKRVKIQTKLRDRVSERVYYIDNDGRLSNDEANKREDKIRCVDVSFPFQGAFYRVPIGKNSVNNSKLKMFQDKIVKYNSDNQNGNQGRTNVNIKKFILSIEELNSLSTQSFYDAETGHTFEGCVYSRMGREVAKKAAQYFIIYKYYREFLMRNRFLPINFSLWDYQSLAEKAGYDTGMNESDITYLSSDDVGIFTLQTLAFFNCPMNWNLPPDAEWKVLLTDMDQNGNVRDRMPGICKKAADFSVMYQKDDGFHKKEIEVKEEELTPERFLELKRQNRALIEVTDTAGIDTSQIVEVSSDSPEDLPDYMMTNQSGANRQGLGDFTQDTIKDDSIAETKANLENEINPHPQQRTAKIVKTPNNQTNNRSGENKVLPRDNKGNIVNKPNSHKPNSPNAGR